MSLQLNREIEQLNKQGINLFSVIEIEAISDEMQISLSKLGWPPDRNYCLILLGNGGKSFWRNLKAQNITELNRVDQYSDSIAREFAQQALAGHDWELLYPGAPTIPLQQLGEIAGWHHPSPMGIGIQQQWGLWYAYRALLITDTPLETSQQPATPNPCDECKGQPCVTECPAKAVSNRLPFQLGLCVDYRLSENSTCSDRCLARLTCPQSSQHRYTMEQIKYHYAHSLKTMKEYYL